jgi:hypothetical protein
MLSTWLLTQQGVPGGPTGPLGTPSRTRGSSPLRESAVENAPALVRGPLARLQDLRLLTAVAPQVVNGQTTLLNPADPVSGFSGIPTNMTSVAETLAAGRNREGTQGAHVNPWASSYAPAHHVYGVF